MLASIIFNVVIIAVMVWCGRFTAKYAVQRGTVPGAPGSSWARCCFRFPRLCWRFCRPAAI